MSVPDSKISICSGVRLSPTYEHTIYFDSRDAQNTYFQGKVVKTFSSYTYLRKEWSIKVNTTMAQTLGWNYLFFTNSVLGGGDGKTYYYFITKIEYINDNTVELFLDLDVMQTFFFDIATTDCFVEREHSATDEIGDNVVDEGLDLGYYVNRSTHHEDLSELCILTLSTVDLLSSQLVDGKETFSNYYGTKIDEVFSGAGLWACSVSSWGALVSTLKSVDEAGKGDGVLAIYMFPKNHVALSTGYSWDSGTALKPVYGIKKDVFTKDFTNPSTLLDSDGEAYTPKNKKLLTYPFSYLYVTNNLGGCAVYPYERFYYLDDNGNRSIDFKYGGTVLPEGGLRIYPRYYDNMKENYEAGLSLSNFPVCSWNQDTYKLWLAQNQNTQQLTIIDGALKIGAGLVTAGASMASGTNLGTGAGVGMIYSGAMSIASLMAQRKDAEIQPLQAKGSLSGSINTAMGYNTFTFMEKCVDPATAKRIDGFFTKFGYRVNRVKKPNEKVRSAFTYTKTVGSNVYGYIPAQYIKQLNGIYDNGITFWRDGDQIGNYSLDNSCL